MNILYVANEALYPTNSGGRIKAYNLVKALALQHQVGLAYISSESMSADHGLTCEYVEQIVLDKPFDLSTFSLRYNLQLTVGSLVSGGFPISKHWLGSSQTTDLLQLIDRQSPQVVVLESSYLLPAAKLIRGRFPQVICLLDAHNVESVLQERKANSASGPMRWLRRRLAANLRRMEERAAVYVQGIGAVSDQDVAWFQKSSPHIPVELIPNGVDLEYFADDQPLPESPVIAFSGSMSYAPNDEGVLWFANQVWPLVIEQQPSIEWLIIGKDPSLEVLALAADSRITVTGTVDDIRPWLLKSRLAIAPILAGGGTRLKILEAMAMQRVVLATTIGAEGILNCPGIIRIDEPRAMADKIIAMLKSDDLPKLGLDNRHMVEQHYGWDAIGQRMVALVEKVVNN